MLLMSLSWHFGNEISTIHKRTQRFLRSYRSDGDAAVDVGGAVEGIKANTVPFFGRKAMHTYISSKTSHQSRAREKSIRGRAQVQLFAHFPRSLGSTNVASSSSSDTRTHCNTPAPSHQKTKHSELKQTIANGQGGWIRTVRPLLTRALTNTSLDSTSSFFCSSPCRT